MFDWTGTNWSKMKVIDDNRLAARNARLNYTPEDNRKTIQTKFIFR